MPAIEFSQEDLLRGTIVEPAWYRMKIASVGENPSKDQQSVNYPVEGIILSNAENGDATYAGVPITWNFNSKAIGFAKGFLESLGVELKPNQRYDLAAAVDHVLDVYVENDLYQGRKVNRVNHKYKKAE